MKHTGLRNLLIFSVAILLGMALAACGGGKYHGELLRAESILDSLPDSAREILKTIPRNTIDTREDLALRDLIAAEVQYKLYEDGPTGADILAAAEETFRTNGDDKRLMRTLFQKAVRHFHAVNYSESLVSALEALEIAEEEANYEYIGRSASIMASIYHYNYNFKEGLFYNSKAIHGFESAWMMSHALFEKADRGAELCDLRRYDESLALSDSLTNYCSEEGPDFIMYACQAKIDPLLYTGCLSRAKAVLDTLERFSTSRLGLDRRFKLDVLVAEGDFHASKLLIDSIKSEDSCWSKDGRIMEAILKYQIGVGEKDSALVTSHAIADLQRQGISRVFNEGLEHAKSRYRENQLEISQTRNARLRLTIFIVAGTAIALVVLGVFLHKFQLRKRNSRIAEILEVFSQQSQRLSDIFGDRVNMINGLCESYFNEKDVKEAMRAKIYRDVCGVLKQLNSRESMERIEKFLNDSQDQIIDKLNSVQGIAPIGEMVAVYSFLGLSSKAIAILCDTSIGNVYTIRTRLREQFAKSGSEYVSELIGRLTRKD